MGIEIEKRLQDIRLACKVDAQMTAIALTRELVVDILEEVVESGHELGGMGEYGRGWNDAKMQTKMIVRGMIERWKNE